MHSPSARGWCGWWGWSCRAPPQQWRPGVLGRLQTPAWTSSHNPLTASPWEERWILTQFLLQMSGRWGIPGAQCTGQQASWSYPAPVFENDGSDKELQDKKINENINKQAKLGVPHSEIQVELDWQPNWYDVWELGRGTMHTHIPIWDL